jgi:hypothetical protein
LRTWGAINHFGVSGNFIINLYFVFRENKNRWVLSFLCALVQLDVFLEVQFQFLMVGHTGKLYLQALLLDGFCLAWSKPQLNTIIGLHTTQPPPPTTTNCLAKIINYKGGGGIFSIPPRTLVKLNF